MTTDTLAAVRSIVVADAEVRRRLLGMPDRESFVRAVVDLASELGVALTPEDVREGLLAARKRHLERWV